MIERACETCEHRSGLSWHKPLPDPCRKCPSPEHPQHRPSRAALEAEVERLEACLRGAEDATDASRAERDAAIAGAAEQRATAAGLDGQIEEAEDAVDTALIERHAALAQVAARDGEIASLRARVEDCAAQYRALSARLESEIGGLRHSLAEVEDERDEARKERDEARAKVAGLLATAADRLPRPGREQP